MCFVQSRITNSRWLALYQLRSPNKIVFEKSYNKIGSPRPFRTKCDVSNIFIIPMKPLSVRPHRPFSRCLSFFLHFPIRHLYCIIMDFCCAQSHPLTICFHSDCALYRSAPENRIDPSACALSLVYIRSFRYIGFLVPTIQSVFCINLFARTIDIGWIQI